MKNPDNGHFVSKTKPQIGLLTAKDFGSRISDLYGDSIDDQFLDLWNAVERERVYAICQRISGWWISER